MDYKTEKDILNDIAASLREAGFDPHDQLTGYIETRNPLYITRLNGARDKIEKINIIGIKRYLAEKQNG